MKKFILGGLSILFIAAMIGGSGDLKPAQLRSQVHLRQDFSFFTRFSSSFITTKTNITFIRTH